MADLKAQIAISADASGVEAGVTKAKKSLRDLGTTAATEGRKASTGLAGAGKGADTAAKDVDRATKSLIASIQRTTAAMQAGSKGTSDYFKVIASQRGVNADALKPYLTQLDAVVAKQKQVGVSAGQTAQAMRTLPAQFTDVATQLAGGQNPFLVLLQQGGQIKDQFGGIKPAISGIASAISPVTVAIGGLAGGIGGLALALNSAEESAKKFAQVQAQLAGTGRAGLLGDNSSIKTFIAQLSQAPGVTRDVATQIISELTKVHEIGGTIFKDLAGTVADYAKATGQDVPAAAKELANAFKDPVQGAKQLDQQLGTLSSTQLQQIETLTRQNDLVGAQKVLLDALKGSVEGLNQPATELQRATNDLGNAWTTAMQAFDKSEGIKTATTLVANLLGKITQFVGYLPEFERKWAGAFQGGLNGVVLDMLGAGPKPGVRDVSGKVTDPAAQAAASATASANAAKDDAIKRSLAVADAYKSESRQVSELTDKQNALRKSLSDAEQTYGKNSVQAKNLADGIKGIGAQIDSIKKKGAGGGGGNSELLAQGRLDIERIQAETAEATNALANQQKILEANRAASLLDDRTYYAEKKRLADEATKAQITGLEAENAALAAQKVSKADALNRDRQIVVNQQKIAKLQADATASQTVLDIQATAAIEAKRRAMEAAQFAADRYVQNAERADQRALSGMGAGNFQRQVDQRRNQRDDQLLQRTDVLEAQRRANQITQDEFDNYLQIEKDAHAKILVQDADFWKKYKEVQGDGIKGAQEALANYIDYTQNAFDRANRIVSDGLDGFADSLTDAIWEGNLDSFEELGDRIGKEILKGIVETQITAPLAKWFQSALSGGDSGSGLVGILSGLFGGGGTSATVGSSLNFAEGGYTGDGGKYQAAGVVHKGEYVVNKAATSAIGPTGRAYLDRLNRRGYADGGFVMPLDSPRRGGSSSTTSRVPGAQIVVQVQADRGMSYDTALQQGRKVAEGLAIAQQRNG